ncbi:Isochorismate synthase 1 [Carex littledalei]|uniref:Isochorismate synthase 1 n=1 Tax=Carex littledalei TaxID=544730 RepID=A0A833RWS9_9POAL|nr:Isochorismate synthase 1 [Carex littledalei]
MNEYSLQAKACSLSIYMNGCNYLFLVPVTQKYSRILISVKQEGFLSRGDDEVPFSHLNLVKWEGTEKTSSEYNTFAHSFLASHIERMMRCLLLIFDKSKAWFTILTVQFEALKILHPRPAAGGLPTEEEHRFIEENGNSTLVYAGAGTVEGTNPSSECEELDLKASQLLQSYEKQKTSEPPFKVRINEEKKRLHA